MELFIVFIFGLAIGSFLNVIIFRLGKSSGIITGRSRCKTCGKNLKWYDLIPVFSFFILNGKCRYCHKNISKIYPLTEFFTGLFFFLYFYIRGEYYLGDIYSLVFISGLMVLVFIDYLYLWLPDRVIIPMVSVAVIYGLGLGDFVDRLIVSLIIASFFAIIHLVSKGKWMGLGDAKLVLLIVLILGYPLGFLAVVASIWIAALFGIVLLLSKKATLKTALPLGTFLSLSSIVFIIFQNELQKIIQTYF